MLIDFKDEDFENKIKSEDVSVIQFSAAWCGPVSYTHSPSPRDPSISRMPSSA